MQYNEPVSSIMTRNVHAIRIDQPLSKAIEMVRHYKIRHLPVLDGKTVVGIISTADLNRLTFSALFEGQNDADEAILEMLTIEQVMSDKPETVHADTPIGEVARIFATKQFHSLPVTSGGELAGIVTTTDVIRYFLRRE